MILVSFYCDSRVILVRIKTHSSAILDYNEILDHTIVILVTF